MGVSYWTLKQDHGWAVKKEGAARVSSVHSSQSDAWAEARRLARGADGEARLKGTDGRIKARSVYGKEPFPPKG